MAESLVHTFLGLFDGLRSIPFGKELIVNPSFRELHKRYCEIKANPMTFDLQTIDIEHEYPILGRAYRQLGVKELKRLRTIKSIQEALGEA